MMDNLIWIPWVLAIILIAVSCVLMSGKGSFLIAGYNMLSKEKKQRYNEKKLCRVVGTGTSLISIIVVISTAYRFDMPASISWIMPWGLFGIIALVAVLVSTICRKKPY